MQAANEIQNQPAWRAGVRSLANAELGKLGPFYAMTVATPCYQLQSNWVRCFEGQEDGSSKLIDAIQPGILYCVKKDEILIDAEVANGKGDGLYTRQVDGSEEKLTAVPTSPGDNRRYLMQTYGQDGLTFFEAFEGLSENVVKPYLFSRLMRPFVFTPEYVEDRPELQVRLRKEGALAVYKELTDAGIRDIKKPEFAKEYGADLQALYIKAIPFVQQAYRAAKVAADAYLVTEDARVHRGAAKGAHYDPLGMYYQYLTARLPVDAALNRALEPQRVVVEMPQGQAAPEVPTIQCQTCGSFSNLLADGRPPKICLGCREPFEADAQASVETSTQRGNLDTGRETPQQRRERLQAEARERKS